MIKHLYIYTDQGIEVVIVIEIIDLKDLDRKKINHQVIRNMIIIKARVIIKLILKRKWILIEKMKMMMKIY